MKDGKLVMGRVFNTKEHTVLITKDKVQGSQCKPWRSRHQDGFANQKCIPRSWPCCCETMLLWDTDVTVLCIYFQLQLMCAEL
jgi:hypothetical protein